MIKTNALLLSDTYKQIHRQIFPQGLTKLVSYWLPRKSMFKAEDDKMIFFGLQAFIKEYLIDYFNDNFFNLTKEEIVDTYSKYMNVQLGEGVYDIESVIALWELGYLPIQLNALPEGSMVNMGIPCIELTNTHEDFAWVVQWVECILQNSLWKMCCHATVGYKYHTIAKKYYDKTVVGADAFSAAADFGMRGMSCMEEATRTSAAWLLSFDKTSTIPALPYIDEYYGYKDGQSLCVKNNIGIGAVSTEHAVQSTNFAVDGNEIPFVKRMLTELYPNTSFSMVADTYDYWNFVENVLPACKEEILAHNGKMLVRPDSGNVIEISVETVKKLWDIFGGTTNEKGYKVLDPHIGIIYGDGCQLTVVEEIWRQLEELGFAANNIAFGIGAFCFSATIEDEKLIALTRDTYGIAMKSTYAVINGVERFIYKDPKTDTNNLKKSHKGCCRVYKMNGKYICEDEYYGMVEDEHNALKPVFKDGKFIKEENFMQIRERIYG